MTIAQVSQKYGVSADTLRYYERIGLLPPVGRTKSGIRDYAEEDCNWVNFIKCMRSAGLPVETLIEYVGLFGQGDETIPARKDVPFPVSWTVKMKKKQKETQDILSYHTQAAGCSDKARAKASGGRQPIEECGRTGL